MGIRHLAIQPARAKAHRTEDRENDRTGERRLVAANQQALRSGVQAAAMEREAETLRVQLLESVQRGAAFEDLEYYEWYLAQVEESKTILNAAMQNCGERAAEAMVKGGFRHLIVVDGGELGGVGVLIDSLWDRHCRDDRRARPRPHLLPEPGDHGVDVELCIGHRVKPSQCRACRVSSHGRQDEFGSTQREEGTAPALRGGTRPQAQHRAQGRALP